LRPPPPASSHRRVVRRLRRRRPRPVPRGGTDAHPRAVGGVVSHRRARRIPRASSSCAWRVSSFPAKYFPRASSFPRQGRHRTSHLLCPLLHHICFASPPPLSPCRRVILAGVGCGVMSTAGSARRNNGLTTSALGATVRIPSQTLGRGFRAFSTSLFLSPLHPHKKQGAGGATNCGSIGSGSEGVPELF
jgi:hypothetical protein